MKPTMRISLFVTCILAGAHYAAAMYTPNPAGRWAPNRFFLAGDFQFNDKDLDPGGNLGNMAGFFARPSYSVARNVTIYGLLGFQRADGNEGVPDVDTGFAGGFGVQGAYVFPGAPEWALGGSFQFMHWASDFQHECVPDRFGFCRVEGGRNIDWNEFQVAPAVSYQVPTVPSLTPYAGLLFDFVDARDSISERDTVGLLFGTNFDPTPRVRLDGQVRVINETGFFLSAGYLF